MKGGGEVVLRDVIEGVLERCYRGVTERERGVTDRET